MKKLPAFKKTLFWDVDPKKLDLEKNAQFIIGRVLDFGDLDEWKIIRDYYGIEKIKKAAKDHVFSDLRVRNFWSIILHVPLKELKCSRLPSLKIPNAFLTR